MDLGDFLLVMSVSGVVISSYQWLRVVMGCFWGCFWVVMGGYEWFWAGFWVVLGWF